MASSKGKQISRRVFTGGLIAGAALAKPSWAGLLPFANDVDDNAKENSRNCAGDHARHNAHDTQSGYAYIGAPTALHAFRIEANAWRLVKTVPALAPIHLEPHPSLPILYVVHHVAQWDHLPRGAVSVYRTEHASLGHVHTQPLSLSATFPVHARVHPDGRSLAIAAEEGGIYNLLPIEPDGSLQAATGIHKVLARKSSQSARPSFVTWHPDGTTLFAADPGNQAISSFSSEDSGLVRCSELEVHPGAGPSQLAIARSGKAAYALNAEDGSIIVHGFDRATKRFTTHLQTLSVVHQPSILATHPRGDLLVTAGSTPSATTLTAWRIDPATERLDRTDQMDVSEGQRAIVFAGAGGVLFGLSASTGTITEWRVDQHGRISNATQVANVAGACSLSVSLPASASA